MSLRLVVHSDLPLKVGRTLLERMQETAGMPYYAPTVQFRRRYTRLIPLNPLAECVCKLARMASLPDYLLEVVEDMGFAVEICDE